MLCCLYYIRLKFYAIIILLGKDKHMQLDKYLALLVNHKGSDLYLTVNIPPCIRLNDKLMKIGETPLDKPTINQIIADILPDEAFKIWKEKRQVDVSYIDGSRNRYRVNIYQQRNRPAIVIRSIVKKIPSMETLGLPRILSKLILQKKGLILFVGSTGTGKSTSMASLINYRNQTMPGHIITVEDPIEYVYQHGKSIISQREVGTDTESFASALKTILRERPDVIQVGEIRDKETMDNVLQIAETGHLVLSTLHANGTNQAIERITSFYPKDIQHKILLDLSLDLSAIVGQRMMTSTKGTPLVTYELLLVTPFISDLIREDKIIEIRDAMRKGKHQRMFTFDQDLLRLYQAGKISRKEALRHANSANDLRLQIKLSEGNHDDSGLKMK